MICVANKFRISYPSRKILKIMNFKKSKIIIKRLKIFELNEGNVLHALKDNENEFCGFKEAYFSLIKQNKIKAWKRHLRMTMNLVVPIGSVQFIFYDFEKNLLDNITIGEYNYCRITVPPNVCCGFKGISSKTSYILNISDTSHDPLEVERKPQSFLNFLSN